VGITAGSREVPGRNACDRRHTYRIIIIIIIIIIYIYKMYFNGGVLQNITADLLVNKFAAFYRT